MFDTHPTAEDLVVPPNTALLKLSFYFSLAMALACVPLFIEGRVDPYTVALCLAVFVVFGTVAGVSLLPGASELRLSPQGFVSSRLFVRREYLWDDVAEFRVAGGGGGPPRAGFDFAPSFRQRRLARVYSRIAYGVDETLAAYVGLPPHDLAALMNSWRLRQTASASGVRTG